MKFLNGLTRSQVVPLACLVLIVYAILLIMIFWATKNLSCWLWYEDMVRETIREMVQREALTLYWNEFLL